MEGLGEFLKRGREKAGISLDDLAQRTRIRVENLESLEREDLDSLPSDAYVRGFVRQVCREVGLAPNDGLLRYDVLRARGAPPDEITWAEERADDTPGRLERALEDPERVVRIARKGGRLAVYAAVGVVVILGGVLARRALDRGSVEVTAAPAPAEARTPPEPAHTPTRAAVDTGIGAVPDPASAARGTVPATERVLPRPEPATTEPAARPEPAPTALPAPRETVREAVEEAAREPTVSTGAQTPADDSRSVLELRATRTVDVSVLLDGRGAERTARLEAGQRRNWKAEEHFVLRASDGGAVRVYLDGKDLGLAGDDGVPTFRTIGPAAR